MSVDLSRLSSAEKLLWGYGVTDSSHIDLEAIANDNGAEIKYRRKQWDGRPHPNRHHLCQSGDAYQPLELNRSVRHEDYNSRH
jgi:hypothetical protein